MNTTFEISSKNYKEDKELLTKALDDLQCQFQVSNSYEMSDPMSRFGWTFFKLRLTAALILIIEEKFSDMIKKSKGHKQQEKLTNFMSDFFESRGCKVKLKMVED